MEKTQRVDGHPVLVVPDVAYMHKLYYRLQSRLPMWVVYRPIVKEYPGIWVTRMHLSLPEHRTTRFVMTHDSLDGIRSLMPQTCTMLKRHPSDPIEIEEIWL